MKKVALYDIVIKHGPAYEVLVHVLITSGSSKGLDKTAYAQPRQSICFLYTQKMELEDGSDQKLDL